MNPVAAFHDFSFINWIFFFTLFLASRASLMFLWVHVLMHKIYSFFIKTAHAYVKYIIFGSERSLRSADVVGLWVCGWVGQSPLCSKAPKESSKEQH